MASMLQNQATSLLVESLTFTVLTITKLPRVGSGAISK